MSNDKTRGRESPFTDDQRSYIRDHYDKWQQVILENDPDYTDSNNKVIQKWRDRIADSIMKSDLFSGRLSTEDFSLNVWEKKIRQCFTTERTRLKRVHAQKGTSLPKHDPQACAIQLRDLAKALLSMRTFEVDARTLFRERNDAAIRERAANIVAANPGAAYQKAHSELWKNANKDFWETELRDSFDVQENREQFPIAMFEAMKAVCQLGTIGHAEMILLYGVRDGDGRLEVKTLHTHSLANAENEAYDLKLVPRGFADWCEKIIPSVIGSDQDMERSPVSNVATGSSIPISTPMRVNVNTEKVQATITQMFPITKHAVSPEVTTAPSYGQSQQNQVSDAAHSNLSALNFDASRIQEVTPHHSTDLLTENLAACPITTNIHPISPAPAETPCVAATLPQSPSPIVPVFPIQAPQPTATAAIGDMESDNALTPLTDAESDDDKPASPIPIIATPAPTADCAAEGTIEPVRKSGRMKGDELKARKIQEEAKRAKLVGSALDGHRGYYTVLPQTSATANEDEDANKTSGKRGREKTAQPSAPKKKRMRRA